MIDFPIGADRVLINCNGGTLVLTSKDYWDSLHIECSDRLRTGE